MTDKKWMQLETALSHAEESVALLREKLLSEGIPPSLVAFALFHKGVALASVKLDPEEKLALCNTLQVFIDDTKELIVEWRN